MARTLFVFRIVAAAATATIRAIVRRLRVGPTLPSWTWSEELFVASYRAVSLASSRNVELMAPRGDGLQLPLGRAVRDGLDVSMEDLDGVRAERYRPRSGAVGTILYFHGGGFVAGAPGLERRVAAERAHTLRCDTWNVSYRLAPQHPFPAALDDAETAYRAVLERGADPAATILYGGSAGAGLALAMLVKIRDLGLPVPGGAVLLWPYADMTFSGTSVQANSATDILDLAALGPVWGPAYVGDADPRDPLVSPAFADLTGLPPLLIIAGGAESLRSCAERIAANGRSAGVDVHLSVYPEKVHGWMLLPRLPATVEATIEIDAWMTERLHLPGRVD